MTLKEKALKYHSQGRPGKLEIQCTKPFQTQQDITLAYSPGVAEPCLEIAKSPDAVFDYTVKGNLVAVVSNGSAVLGLGNIGPLAAKPVMEGKAILFKKFADIDCFDIEINAPTAAEVIQACTYLEPTFGGINLEDIKAPECFEIEEVLKSRLKIPVFHDDQHGTAIVSGAALLNALEIIGKSLESVVIVVNGAGSAGIACAQMYHELGAPKENIILCDSLGIITTDRQKGMNPYKQRFARDPKTLDGKKTLFDALNGADVFCGCSVGGAVTSEMVSNMKAKPIIFAMANPDPEILPQHVFEVRKDAIMATGRSDYPNQVNNVLGYPYIFRGALDTRATEINEAMKLAAVKALALLAKEDIPKVVTETYGGAEECFGPKYLIPKPFDPRLLSRISYAVAKAAMETGVARKSVDLNTYMDQLEARMGVVQATTQRIKSVITQSSQKLTRIVFAEGYSPTILKAADQLKEQRICEPILLGDHQEILDKIQSLSLENLHNVKILDPKTFPQKEEFIQTLYQSRYRKGMTLRGAKEAFQNLQTFGSLLLLKGEGDALCGGIDKHYADALRPALQTLGTHPDQILSGVYILVWKNRMVFFADTTVHIDPNSEELAQIAMQTYDFAKIYLTEPPRLAFLSFSHLGSHSHPFAQKVRDAVNIVSQKRPEMEMDGELHADVAFSSGILESQDNLSNLKGPANILIFPDLTSGNIAYKLLHKIGGATAIGPLLLGTQKTVSIFQQESEVEEVINLVTLTVHRVQKGF